MELEVKKVSTGKRNSEKKKDYRLKDGTIIRLSEENVVEIYRYQLKQFRMQDAKNHLEEKIEQMEQMLECSDSTDADEYEYVKSKLETAKSLMQDKTELNSACDSLAEDYIRREDCNIAENDLWDDIVTEFWEIL